MTASEFKPRASPSGGFTASQEAMVEERVYEPQSHRGWGLNVWRDMFSELYRSRELAWRLFMRDFTARYRQSVLGTLWVVIMPLVVVGTFVFLNRSGFLRITGTGVPYPVYALVGLTLWQVFAGGVVACTGALVAGGSLIVKINFPKVVLILAAMSQVLFELVVRLALVAVLLIAYRVKPQPEGILFPFAMIPLVALTLALGLFTSLANVVLRDMGNVLTVLLTFLMFLTPVVYPVPESGPLRTVMTYNPLTSLIQTPRELLFTGTPGHSSAYAATAAASFLLLLIGWRIFHLVQVRIAERV